MVAILRRVAQLNLDGHTVLTVIPSPASKVARFKPIALGQVSVWPSLLFQKESHLNAPFEAA